MIWRAALEGQCFFCSGTSPGLLKSSYLISFKLPPGGPALLPPRSHLFPLPAEHQAIWLGRGGNGRMRFPHPRLTPLGQLSVDLERSCGVLSAQQTGRGLFLLVVSAEKVEMEEPSRARKGALSFSVPFCRLGVQCLPLLALSVPRH